VEKNGRNEGKGPSGTKAVNKKKREATQSRCRRGDKGAN
jgi:hypothetical protein